MAKTDYSVVRNEGYMAGSFNVRERHNERKNENYYNGDIEPERTPLNVHFLRHFREDGTPETYEETFKRLMSEGVISDKWHKPTSRSFDELVFDVNTDYFERNGGYDYAKKFYDEAYRLAVKEVGGEQYILSAVLHADERNKALSERLGRDVYHYHLHVVYVPVVEKREYFRKKKGEPEGAERKLKSVYAQISHAKKWPGKMFVERDGKQIQVNAYSLLQDRYFEHMKAAGFEGFERGERGSTAEHLNVLDYKIKQDEKRLGALDAEVEQTEAALAKTEQTLEKKTAQTEKLDAAISVKKTKAATLAEINGMGKPALLGGVHLTDDEAKRLKSLARQTVKSDERMAKLKRDMDTLQAEITAVKRERDDAKRESGHWYREFKALENEVKPFIDAIRKFPQKMLELAKSLFPPVMQQEQSREIQPQRKRNHDIGGR